MRKKMNRDIDWWERLMADHLPRIGLTPKERLSWALRSAQKDPERMTEGDWENLRFELALLCGLKILGGQGGVGASQGEVERPSRAEAEAILKDFQALIRQAVKREREPIRFKTNPSSGWDEVEWDERRGGFNERKHMPEGWIPLAHQALKNLILEHGHLMKECIAPAPWGGGRNCGMWFVVNRPDQKYCSGKCQSRATSKEKREREARKESKPIRGKAKSGRKGRAARKKAIPKTG